MMHLDLHSLAAPLAARLRGSNVPVQRVCTDTRQLQPGDLFVALRGARFDAHDYIDQAAAAGAAAVVVSAGTPTALPALEVADTRLALGALARFWRQRQAPRLIAVTGSNGKTTVKEMLGAILSQSAPALVTAGNYNNEIGVPLTLLRLRDEPWGVIEMGANHGGEIRYLTGLTLPDVALLNNAGRAHLEGFGSLEGVARAKAEIMEGLGPQGCFVYNADDRFAPLWRELASGRRTLGFGLDPAAEVHSPAATAALVWGSEGFHTAFPVSTPAGETELRLALAGEHNRLNALAATAGALALGVPLAQIQAGLAALRPVPGRLCPLRHRAGGHLVDDSYNANPESVAAAIAVLASAPGRRTLVLGDLAELGAGAADMHAELGRRAHAAGIERLFCQGPLSAAAAQAFGPQGRHFTAQGALIDALLGDLRRDDSLLVKGSRSAGMEQVVQALRTEAAAC